MTRSAVPQPFADAYRGKRVVITGGLGFLGSTLAHRLVQSGAGEIVLVDTLDPRYGGNRYNLRGIEDRVRIIQCDVRDPGWYPALHGADYVFHLAAQVSYIDSLALPAEDLEVNAGSTLSILQACRHLSRAPRVIFASSRMVVGKVETGHLTESVFPNPLSLYGVHKLASERYLEIYHRNFGISTLAFRITNPYGPRQQMHHSKYSLVGWFVRQAMEGRTISIFGDGAQIRDYIFVDDIAEGFLRCAAAPVTGEVVNLGSGVPTPFGEMVRTVVDVVGKGRIEFVPWPANYERLETGDVQADISKLERLTGWRPNTDLRTGVEHTFRYYAEHGSAYLR